MKARRGIFILAGLAVVLLAVSFSGYTRLAAFNELSVLAHRYATDKGPRDHYYTELYDRLFLPVKNSVRKVCEIGIAEGRSLKMWRQYFRKAMIYGIDINDSSKFNSDTVKTFIADQADRNQLKKFIDTLGGGFDIILDDGGHSMEQQQVSFAYLFKYVKPGGYYIIEDVHTSLAGPKNGVEQNGENTTLTMIENFMRTGRIKSKYMTGEEAGYLNFNIKFCNMLRRKTINGFSMVCVFKKKDLLD